MDLSLPSAHVFQGLLIVAGHADHECVSVLVLYLAVDTEVLVTTGIVDLELELLILDILKASEHIKHSRFVVIVVRIVQVIRDHARLTSACVTDQHKLQILLSCLVFTMTRARRFIFRRFRRLLRLSIGRFRLIDGRFRLLGGLCRLISGRWFFLRPPLRL